MTAIVKTKNNIQTKHKFQQDNKYSKIQKLKGQLYLMILINFVISDQNKFKM